MQTRRITPLVLPLILISAMAVTGCARQISSGSYEGVAAGETVQTWEGVIQSARQVQIQEQDTLEGNKTGQLLGGLAGGVAGARFGDGVGRLLASAGGAIAGAFAGALVEQEIKRQPAMEYIIRSDRGDLVTMVQGMDNVLVVGQRVYVQQSARGRGRVIPAI